MKNLVKDHWWTVFMVALVAVTLDVCTVHPHYELEPATVRKVTVNTNLGYRGDPLTVIRFDDGFGEDIAGDRGAPGDRIMAWRQRGTRSLLGILGDQAGLK